MLSLCLRCQAWCGWSHALGQLAPGPVPLPGVTSAFPPARGAHGRLGSCSPVQKSHRDNCCAGRLSVPPWAAGMKGCASSCRCSCLSLSLAVQLIKSALHEKRLQPVLKNHCAWSKARRHVKHAGLEGEKKTTG